MRQIRTFLSAFTIKTAKQTLFAIHCPLCHNTKRNCFFISYHYIKNADEFELKTYLDILKPLKKNLKQIKKAPF